MDGHAFDEISRAMTRGLPRRQILTRLGAGGFAAALLGAVGLDRAHSARPAAQAESCRLALVATVRLGPSAGAILTGTTPGELRGELSFALGTNGAIDSGRLRLADDTELPVVGQATGRALNLQVEVDDDHVLILVGTAEQDLGTCQGLVDGLLTGPQAGDLGDWHATATALGQSGGTRASGSGTGGSTGGGGGSGQASHRTAVATAAATGEATTEATTEPEECPEGETDCAGVCIDLQTNPANCGACGNACGSDLEYCVGGECHCPVEICGSVCVDTFTDQANCGACGNACASGVCEGGACVAALTCGADQADCGGVCVDPFNDPNNCGGCGIVCPAESGTFCYGGGCVCPEGTAACGGVCIDVTSDPSNCGACGYACVPDQICSAGACACPEGTALCEGFCLGCPPGSTLCRPCVCSDPEGGCG